MGLFDFFKRDKGKELFEENADAQKRAEAIRGEIKRLGLPGNINVLVEGSRVRVIGDVPDEATRQKLAMIVGNVKYIDAVDDSGLSGGQAQGPAPKVHEVQSGETGTRINVWSPDSEPARRVTEYYADVLNKIGLKARVVRALKPLWNIAPNLTRSSRQVSPSSGATLTRTS